jgi:hypothetical protein
MDNSKLVFSLRQYSSTEKHGSSDLFTITACFCMVVLMAIIDTKEESIFKTEPADSRNF